MYPEDVVLAGDLAVSPAFACTAWLRGRRLPLTARQVVMLALLVRAGGRLLSRDALYEGTAGRRLPPGSRAVEMDVWRIRRALGSYGASVRMVRKVGYALDVAMLEPKRKREGTATRS